MTDDSDDGLDFDSDDAPASQAAPQVPELVNQDASEEEIDEAVANITAPEPTPVVMGLEERLRRQNAALAAQNRRPWHPLSERDRLHALVQRLWEYLPMTVEGDVEHDELVGLAKEAEALGIELVK